jgi:hypothetical protein
MKIEYNEAKEIIKNSLTKLGIVFNNDAYNLSGEYFSLTFNSMRYFSYNTDYNIINVFIKQQPYCYGKKNMHRRILTFDIINGDYHTIVTKIKECIEIGKKYAIEKEEQEKQEQQDENETNKWLKANNVKGDKIKIGNLVINVYGKDNIDINFYGDLKELKTIIQKLRG